MKQKSTDLTEVIVLITASSALAFTIFAIIFLLTLLIPPLKHETKIDTYRADLMCNEVVCKEAQ